MTRLVSMKKVLDEHVILFGQGGLHGNVLRISPPLSITREEADEGVPRPARRTDGGRP